MNSRSYFNGIKRWKIFALSLLLGLILGMGQGEPAQVPNPLGPATPRQQPPPSPPPVTLPVVKSVRLSGARQAADRAVAVNVTGGQEIRGRVELSGPAPCVWNCGKVTLTGQKSGGLMVQLSINNPALAKVPGAVLVPTDQTYQDFSFLTAPVATPTQAALSAAVQNSPPQSATFTIVPPVLINFALDQGTVMGGTTVIGRVYFSGPPASAGAVRAQLSTTNSAAVKIPSSVALELGKTAVDFQIPTLGVDQDRNVHVVAQQGDKTLAAPLTVRAAALTEVANAYPCCDNPFRITLNGAPPPGGAVVQLVSENPARITVPATVTIPADKTSLDVTAQSTPGNSDTRVKITASYKGVAKNWSVLSREIIKPDLVVKEFALFDQYSNPIAQPQDSQPFKMCVSVWAGSETGLPPNVPVPTSALRVSYSGPTGKGTSTGRTFDINVSFPAELAYIANRKQVVCSELPGLQPGGHYDVSFTADYHHQVDEKSENNNTEKYKITR